MITVAYAALWMFVFSMQCEDIVGLTSVGAISRVMGIPALALSLLAVVISGRFRRLHGFHFAAVLFVICAGCTLLFFTTGVEIPRKFWTYVQLLLVLWMIWELAPSWKRMSGLLTAYVFGSYVAALGTIMLYRSDAALNRFSVGGGDANDLAMTLALALPMAWYVSITDHRPLLRWICKAYLPVGVFAIGLTASRGGMLAGIVGLMIVPLTMTKLTPAKLATAISLLCLSGALAVAYVPEKVVHRLSTTGAEVENLELGGRVKVWMAGLKAFVHKPLMGHGTSTFKYAAAPYGGLGKVAHNSFLSVLVEQGLIGFLFYSMMFLTALLAILGLPQLPRRFALVLFATLVVAMLPLTWEDRKQVWFILAVLVGLSQAWIDRQGAVQPSSAQALSQVRALRAARLQEPLIARGRGAQRDNPA
jgi:O-antigen ligase